MTRPDSVNLLEAAQKYSARFPVIPIKPDKKPFIPWADYQKRLATPGEVRGFWTKYPEAMIGIVTGGISGLLVVDCDTAEGYAAVQEHLPDSLLIPTASTPRGGRHLYFAMPGDKNLTVGAGVLPGVDFRGEGGYIIAPPSSNGTGKAYVWLTGLSLDDCPPPPLPDAIFNLINNSISTIEGCLQAVDSGSSMFREGTRDNDLFHVALTLLKGGANQAEVFQVLRILANNCNPPFPEKELNAKIESALKRLERKERALSDEVREWVLSTTGYFLSTDIYSCLQLSTRDEKKNVSIILRRLADQRTIEKHKEKNGCYRLIDAEAEDIDFLNASAETVEIRWPFQIERYVKTLPKNIIIIAGEPNAGKTAFLLNVVKMNQAKHPINYFSSEMGPIELRDRLSKFDVQLSSWSFIAKERASNFADVIKPDELNIVDFLEIHDEFYKIGGLIKDIYDKLNKGIAMIAIQKNKGAEYGLGGTRGLEKARLYLAMEPGRLKIVKGKNWAGIENPNGLAIDFKLAQGCKFVRESEWHK